MAINIGFPKAAYQIKTNLQNPESKLLNKKSLRLSKHEVQPLNVLTLSQKESDERIRRLVRPGSTEADTGCELPNAAQVFQTEISELCGTFRRWKQTYQSSLIKLVTTFALILDLSSSLIIIWRFMQPAYLERGTG